MNSLDAIRSARRRLSDLEAALSVATKDGACFSKTEENRKAIRLVEWLAERLVAEVERLNVSRGRGRPWTRR